MTAVIILLVILFIAALMISSHKKAVEEETNNQDNTAQRLRELGFPVVEIRTDEVDGKECDVANFAVKGLFFRSPEDQDAARTLEVGDSLNMEPEPDNPKDPNAIKVTMMDGHHIGYVDRSSAKYVNDNLSRLVKFVVSKVDDYGDPPYIYAEAFFKKECFFHQKRLHIRNLSIFAASYR